MQGLQPHNLSNEELLRHAYITGYDKLPPEWVAEICKRFAALLDDGK
jgi:hypothetical protein